MALITDIIKDLINQLSSTANEFATQASRKRFTYNGLIETSKSAADNINEILKSCDANIVFADGKYSIRLKTQGDAVATLTINDIIGEVVQGIGDIDSLYNRMTVDFNDIELEFKTNTAIYDDETTRNSRDGGQVLEKRMTVNGINNFYEAMAFAEKELKKTYYTKSIECKTHLGFDYEVGDIIGVTIDSFGYADKEFRIVEKKASLSGYFSYKLLEHQDEIYDITADNTRPSNGTITYPNPYAKLPAPTGLSISSVASGKALASFTGYDSAIVDYYELIATNNSNANQTFTFTSKSSPIYFEIDEIGTFSVTVNAVSDLKINGYKTSAINWNSTGFNTDWSNVTGTGKPEDSATKSRIYAQDAQPNIFTSTINDIWIDTNDKNKVYTFNGTNWVLRRDEDIDAALTQASVAIDTLDGNITTFYLDNMPSGSIGDLWFDTNDDNKLYRHNGTTFVAVGDSVLSELINRAANAQNTADSKIVTYFGDTEPAVKSMGDLWYSESTKVLKRWTGTQWQVVSNSFDNTNDLIDGADLGLTATWANVSGKAIVTAEIVDNAITTNEEVTITASAANGSDTQSVSFGHTGFVSCENRTSLSCQLMNSTVGTLNHAYSRVSKENNVLVGSSTIAVKLEYKLFNDGGLGTDLYIIRFALYADGVPVKIGYGNELRQIAADTYSIGKNVTIKAVNYASPFILTIEGENSDGASVIRFSKYTNFSNQMALEFTFVETETFYADGNVYISLTSTSNDATLIAANYKSNYARVLK